MPATEKLAYTINEFCKASGNGRSAVYEAIRDGELRAVKRGRRTLILAEDAAAFLKGLPPLEAAIA